MCTKLAYNPSISTLDLQGANASCFSLDFVECFKLITKSCLTGIHSLKNIFLILLNANKCSLRSVVITSLNGRVPCFKKLQDVCGTALN